MRAEIIAIGTELLIGHTVNTNACYLSEELNAMGIDVYYHSTVGDNTERIIECLRAAVSRSDLIILTGGLGPTADDITHDVLAEFTELELHEDPEQKRIIEKKFTNFKTKLEEIPPINYRQARVLKVATIIPNPIGTAIGMIVAAPGKHSIIASFPGVPSEMEAMFQETLVPYLKNQIQKTEKLAAIISKKIKFTNITESRMAQIIHDAFRDGKIPQDFFNSGNPSLAPYAILGECYLRITAKAESEHKARNMIQLVQIQIESLLKDYIYGYDDDTIPSVLARALQERNLSISCAESCTGGLLSKMLTDIPGASVYTKLNIVTYSNESKEKILGVSAGTLKEHGAVSSQTVEEMVKGLAKISGADINVSISGIAGPSGASADKPIGTIFIAILWQEPGSQQLKRLEVKQLDWRSRSLQRDQVRELAAKKTLFEVLQIVKKISLC
jgi:nicotinamide-nucleotide amidase